MGAFVLGGFGASAAGWLEATPFALRESSCGGIMTGIACGKSTFSGFRCLLVQRSWIGEPVYQKKRNFNQSPDTIILLH